MDRKIVFSLIVLCTISLAFVLKPSRSAETSFAVVELFTSEGCSSCPPADALIAKIEKESSGKPVYILAYHVDYWDKLGWKDTFSDRRNSARQNEYANWLNLNSVYTPQIVVNGSREFIGSEENTLRSAISTALSQQWDNKLEIAVEKQNGASLSLNYRTGEPAPGFNLIVALVSPNATNKIARGENSGQTLSHVQIVRSFETFDLGGKAKGTLNFALGKENLTGEVEIIAFLQNSKTGKITAATKVNTKVSQI